MFSITKNILSVACLLLAVCGCAMAQKADSTNRHPVWTIEAGYNLPEFYNYGFEVNGGYYPFRNKWVRIGPAVQSTFFFTPYKEWFENYNKEQSLIFEGRLNLLANIEFVPAPKNTFFIGIAPYAGYAVINNKGNVQNDVADFDLSYNYNVDFLDWGGRFKLGGYLGKKKQFGLQSHLQFSMRGIADDDPRTKFFNIGMQDCKSFMGFTFMYKIK